MSPYNNMRLYSSQSQFHNVILFPMSVHFNQSPHFSYQFLSPQSMPPQSMPSQFMPPSPRFPAMNAKLSAEISSVDLWILDTGASHHMTPDLTVIHRSIPYEGFEKIIVGNDEGLEVQNIVHGTLQTPIHTLHLKNILHMPMLIVNLLSVKKLCKDNNSWFICDNA